MKNPFLVFVVVAVFSGCTDLKPKRFVDVTRGKNSQIVELLAVRSDSVKIKVEQNLAPVYLSSVRAEVIEGQLYLFPKNHADYSAMIKFINGITMK